MIAVVTPAICNKVIRFVCSMSINKLAIIVFSQVIFEKIETNVRTGPDGAKHSTSPPESIARDKFTLLLEQLYSLVVVSYS